ncbi:hypothetical protein K438DRAFT_1998986 [Mycena galopus ATCC 62051]|nr:hypothetical protein K438DRAFT_1998986 [Mycena galopus ATCC 62051]
MARTHTSLTSRASRSSCPAPSIISRAAVETAIRMGASKSLAASSCPAPFPSTSHPRLTFINPRWLLAFARTSLARCARKPPTSQRPVSKPSAWPRNVRRAFNPTTRGGPLPDIKNLGSRYGIKTVQSKTAVRSFFASLSSPFFLCPAHLDFFLARLQAPIVASATQQHN